MRVLDLFSGLHGWSQAFADAGHDVVTVELDPKMESTITADVSELDAIDVPGPWDVILASPPCQRFSVATIGKNWKKNTDGTYTPMTEGAIDALALVGATRRLIDELNPKFFIIENPRGMLRKMPVVAGLPRATVTYCQYGETRMKPTDLWGNFPPSLWLHPPCSNGDTCHESAPRGAKTGTQGIQGASLRSKVPYALSDAVMCAVAHDVLTMRR